jgi:hypothetical protein
MLSLAVPHESQGAQYASLSGTVYVDLNTDGVFQQGDWGVRGDLIQLFDQNDLSTPIAETYTDGKGQYTFTGLAAGTYTLKNTVPSFVGNTANIGEIYDAAGISMLGNLGAPNSALAQISEISLNEGYQAFGYNFGNDQYPLQLYSKYLLVADPNNNIKPAVVAVVPEPALAVSLLALAGMACGWAIFRRRQTKF